MQDQFVHGPDKRTSQEWRDWWYGLLDPVVEEFIEG
jgi:hypothetical protein